MKKKHLYPLLLALSLTVVAQDYNLIIRTKSGDTITVPTDDIEQMDFAEIVQSGGQLKAPELTYEQLSEDSFKMSWSTVEEANGYFWNLDGASTSYTSQTSYTFTKLSEGSHTFAVKALADTESGYTDSEYSSVTVFVAGKADTHSMRFLIGNYTHNYARISFMPGTAESYKVALIPASDTTPDADIIDMLNNLPSDQVYNISSLTEERTFEGLAPETAYVVAAIPSDVPDMVYRRSFTTEAAPEPGAKVSIFPPGVSATGGFVDVDKVGNNIYGSDGELCWACVSANMAQWWISDYKTCTGSDYTFKHPLPEESLYYTTPVMDVISQAYYHQAGDVYDTLKWFFCGEEHPERCFMNNICTYNLDYEYVHGGFMDMSENQFREYCEKCDIIDLFSGKSSVEMKEIFADKMLGWLRHGPVYFCISGMHALCAWGAEYTVQPDGSKLITKLYVAENDIVSANLKNALQEAPVDYSDYGTGKTEHPYITMPTIHDGGGINSGRISVFCAIRSWNSVN